MNDVVTFITLVVLMYDLWLVLVGKPTISQEYQKLFPSYIDLLIAIPVVVSVYFISVNLVVKLVLIFLAGHVFFPNKERYHK